MTRPATAEGARLRRPLAIGLLAATGLLLEVAWTRVAGLLLFGDAAYLVVSLAVLGLAIGAAAGALRPDWLRPGPRALAAALAGLAAVGAVGLAGAAAGRGGATLVLALAVPPFALLGLALAGAFADAAHDSPRLYRADLIGAGLGAAGSVPLLALVGAPGAALLAGLLGVAAAWALPGGPRPAPADSRPARGAAGEGTRGAARATLFAATALVVAAAALGAATRWPDPPAERIATPKPMVEALRGGEALASRWGSVGRSDLIARSDGARVLYLDGGAGSLLPDAAFAPLWRADPSRFPFLALQPRSTFVVGAGAGLEVAHARETDVERILAAEINGAGVRLARERLGEDDPFVDTELRLDDARSVLQASGERFDLIVLAQAVTRTAEPRHLALAENTLYTVEAFEAWLDALTPGGAVSLELYDELTLTRALTTALAALRARGIDEAEGSRHLLVLLDQRGPRTTPLLLLFREPLERARAIALARAAENGRLDLVHVPGLLEAPPLDRVARGTRSVEELVALETRNDVSPTFDDAPFFWSFSRGLPPPLRQVLAVVGLLSLAGAAALALGLRRAPREARLAPIVFAGLGIGFLALEIAALARTQLLVGHPAGSLALTLGALLVGAGAGSGSMRRAPDRWDGVTRAALIAAAAIAAWSLAWPPLADAARAWPQALRATLAAATLVPVGLALGRPFPLALRRVGARGAAPVARAWAVNGVASLLGAAGATALAHLIGFDLSLAAAAAAYLVAAGAAALAARSRAGAA